MGLLALFRKTSSSANVAQGATAHHRRAGAQRARKTRTTYPLLRRELLEVIHKYVNVDPSAVQVNLEFEDGHEVLELSVALPGSETRQVGIKGNSATVASQIQTSFSAVRSLPSFP